MSMNIRDRYQNDAAFRTLVDTLHSVIERGDFTPTEIREAAMLAQIMYEERHVRPIIFTRDDVINGKV
jgi:hypothetical protein